MDCYKEFAAVYDELIHADVPYDEWAEFIKIKCEEYDLNFDSYLDLACGTGNLLYALHRSFKTCYAIDLSDDMLCEAEKKFNLNPFKPKFICQDMQDFCVNHKFNLITCCLDSLNYIVNEQELLKTFKNVKYHLKEDGLFIFDINSCYKLSEVLGNNTFTYDSDDIFYVWENEFSDDIVDMFLTFFIKEQEHYMRFDEEHRERAYSEEMIEKLLGISGFKVIGKYDEYSSKRVGKETERITYIVKG